MKKLLIISIAFAIIGLGVNGFAQPDASKQILKTQCKGMGKIIGGEEYKNMPWYTELSPKSQDEVAKIIDNNKKDMIKIKLQLSAKESELDSMIYNDKSSKEQIDKLIAEIKEIRGDLYQKKIKTGISLKNAGVPYPHYNFASGRHGAGGKHSIMKMKNCPMSNY